MLTESLIQKLRKVRSVNETSATFRSIIPTATEPSGDAGTATGASILDHGPIEGESSQRNLLLVPFGTGNAGTFFNLRVISWRPADASTGLPASRLWVPLIVAEFQVILGTVTGVAGGVVVGTEKFCDSQTLSTSNIAYLATTTLGAGRTEVQFSTESSATDCNSLYCFV